MLNRIPRGVPPLPVILDALGNPSTDKVARALDVSPSTVRRWIAAGEAPRAAMLALFWLTPWGHSQVDADAFNDAVAMRLRCELLADRLADAEREL